MSEQIGQEQVEQYDEVCPICGAAMQATHAPWCEFPDGTPVPEDCRAMIKAQTECIQAIKRMYSMAPDAEALLWAVGGLLESLGASLRIGIETGILDISEEETHKQDLVTVLKAFWAAVGHDADRMAKELPATEFLSQFFTMQSPEVQAVMAGEA